MSRSTTAHRPVGASRPAQSMGWRRRALSAATIGLLAGAAVFGVASPALAHDELLKTGIVANEQTGGPESFQLTFSNSIIKVGTEIIVTGPDGADASDGTADIEGPVVTQPLAADLAPGEYTAAWRVVSSDGHPIEGAFGISVAADGTGEIVAAQLGKNTPAEATPDSATPDSGSRNDQAPTTDPESTQASTFPVGGVIAAVGGVVVVVGAATAMVVGNRRRAAGMAGDSGSASDTTSTTSFTDTHSSEEDTK